MDTCTNCLFDRFENLKKWVWWFILLIKYKKMCNIQKIDDGWGD